MINNFLIKTIGYIFNVTITASAKFEKPLLIAGAFFYLCFYPPNNPHQNVGALILSLLKVEK